MGSGAALHDHRAGAAALLAPAPRKRVLTTAVSLYVHIPFCRRKCLYCDFYSVPVPAAGKMERVVRETLRQAARLLEKLGGPPVETVFIGGGTPSILPPALLRQAIEEIGRLAGPRVGEWTVEANPESLSGEVLGLLREGGVNRLSLGLQTLQDPLLRRLGRMGNRRTSLEALRLLEREWPGRINLDFIAGIPGQTPGQLLADLEQALALPAAGHISLYTLTPLEDSELAAAVDPDQQEETWLAGRDFLESHGYRNYEISNFARPGQECRHNLRYWLLQPYLGAGPAAVSTLPWGGRIVRLSNPADLDLFLAGAPEGPGPGWGWGAEAEEIGAEDFLFETLMMGLRLEDGIPRRLFERRFGRGLDELLGPLWSRWQEEGLAAAAPVHSPSAPDRPAGGIRPEEAGRPAEAWRLTERGRLLLDRLLIEAQELRESAAALAGPVRWPDPDY